MWITEKELERKAKKADQFRWKKNITISYTTTVRKRGKVSGHQSENERQGTKSEQEHIKHVSRKFLEVSRCSRVAKQRHRNVLKKGAARAKFFFFLAD